MKNSTRSAREDQALRTFADDFLIERQAQTEAATRRLRHFLRQAWPVVEPSAEYQHNWHIDCIAEHLQSVTDFELRKLVINLPPRHAKSLIVSVFWFCWAWVYNPGLKFLYTSYAEEMATRDANKSRLILASEWYQQRWGDKFTINPWENSKTRFSNDKGGHRISTSVGGKGTGEGGQIVVVDDAHKIDDARSESKLQEAIAWWDGTMSSRGNDPRRSARVIVAHRISEKDLTGHVYAKELGYEALVIPAHFDPNRIVYSFPAGTSPDRVRAKHGVDCIVPTKLQLARPELRDPRTVRGELLWPDRFGEAEIRDLTLSLGPWGAAGLLDQRPAPEGGGIVSESHLRYFESRTIEQDGRPVNVFRCVQDDGSSRWYRHADCKWFQVCDTAMQTGQENDYTVVLTAAVTADGRLLFVDLFRDRVPVPRQYGKLVEERLKYPQLLYQAVEPKGSGIGLIQQGALNGTPFRALKVSGDKTQRAAALATMYQNHMVYHLIDAPWRTTLETEVLKFPNAAHDDCFDAAAYAAILFTTDALLAQTREVGDLVVFPTPADVAARAEKVGMSAERYELLFGFGSMDEIEPADPFLGPAAGPSPLLDQWWQ
jgi:predicted phage terminase large subunit-like protein